MNTGAAPRSAFGPQNAQNYVFPPPPTGRRPAPWWRSQLGVIWIVVMAAVAIIASIGVFGILERKSGAFREIFVENFDTPAALGDFPG